MFIRRTVIQEVGGFDERFFMYEEDLELSLRVREYGYEIWYESMALVRHVGQGSTRDGSEFMSLWSPRNPKLKFYVYHMVRNRLINASSHARGKDAVVFWLIFPMLCMYKTIQFIINKRYDGVSAMLNAWVAYVKNK
jgi:GT2 family glycosyltransferase